MTRPADNPHSITNTKAQFSADSGVSAYSPHGGFVTLFYSGLIGLGTMYSKGVISISTIEMAANCMEEAALSPNTLCAAMDSACEMLGLHSLYLMRMDGGPSEFIPSQRMAEAVPQYHREGWWTIDDRTQRLGPLSARRAGIIRDQDGVSEELRKTSQIFNEFYKQAQMDWCAGWRTDVDEAEWAWALQRNNPITDEETELLSKLAPCFNRATRLSMQVLALQATSVLEGLSIAGMPAAILDHRGQVCMSTPAAEMLFSNSFGIRNGILWAEDSRSSRELARVSSVARGHLPGNLLSNFVIERMDGRSPVIGQPLCIRSSGLDLLPGARLILMFVDTAAQTGLPAKELMRLFGLTPSEAEVAMYLSQGLSISEISEIRRSSRETVRIHLKALFSKLDVQRQSDLIRIIDRIGRTGIPRPLV